jgi:hypothetical protein
MKYRKHFVQVAGATIKVKDYMRMHPEQFTHIQGRVPITNEIVKVLYDQGYTSQERIIPNKFVEVLYF